MIPHPTPHQDHHDALLAHVMEHGVMVVCERCLANGQYYSVSRTCSNTNTTAPKPAGT